VFALDITDPSAFGRGLGALWEFTERDDPAIGHVHAAPQIVKLNTAARGQAPLYRYFVLVASGINGLAADGNGTLFVLSLDKPAGQRWQAGVNYFSMTTSGANPTLANALSAPGLVTAADGSATLAYAGDLQGNLWRFDLAARSAQHVFSARDAAGRAQPVTHAPKALFAPGGGYLLVFGTGRLLEQADMLRASFLPQSLYAFRDRLRVPADPAATRADLVERTLSGGESYQISGRQLDYFGTHAKLGWFIDFANTSSDGERLAGSISASGGAIIASTVMPGADACAPPASRTYVLDAVSGMVAEGEGGSSQAGSTAKRVPTVSMLAPLLVEANAVAGIRDATGAAIVTRSYTLIHPGTGPAMAGSGGADAETSRANTFSVRFKARRLGWREVSNWQELHEAANR
jgi:type IV pilus assembly protein PilY1